MTPGPRARSVRVKHASKPSLVYFPRRHRRDPNRLQTILRFRDVHVMVRPIHGRRFEQGMNQRLRGATFETMRSAVEEKVGPRQRQGERGERRRTGGRRRRRFPRALATSPRLAVSSQRAERDGHDVMTFDDVCNTIDWTFRFNARGTQKDKRGTIRWKAETNAMIARGLGVVVFIGLDNRYIQQFY